MRDISTGLDVVQYDENGTVKYVMTIVHAIVEPDKNTMWIAILPSYPGYKAMMVDELPEESQSISLLYRRTEPNNCHGIATWKLDLEANASQIKALKTMIREGL